MQLIHNIRKAFNNLCNYDTFNLIHTIQSLNISLHKIAPFITSPVNLEYGRNVIYQSEFVEIFSIKFPQQSKDLCARSWNICRMYTNSQWYVTKYNVRK